MGLKRSVDKAALHEVQPRQYPRDDTGLIEQLGNIDPAVRRWAARDLAAFPEAADAVCERLRVEPDPTVRTALFSCVVKMGGPVVVDAMIGLLRSEDASLRNGAIEVLANLPDSVAPHIENLLHDSDGDVRIFTVNLLGDLRHRNVPMWLDEVLRHETEINVVGAALEVLVEVGGAEALPALHAAQRRFADDAFISFSVALAIQRIEAS